MIFIIKVTTNKEERAIEMISDRAVKKNIELFSVARPHGLKGYIILEAVDRETAEEAAFNLPYVKGIIGKTVQYEEIQQMLEPKIEDINIMSGGTLTRQYTVEDGYFSNRGMFTEVDKEKTVKAILIDTELNKKIEEITKTDIEATTDC